MTSTHRLLLALAGLATITAFGTAGYVVVQDLSWVDALYMTVITISTVGYKEVAPLGTEAKLFTIVLIFMSVGLAVYFLTTVAEILVEGGLRDYFQRATMQRKVDNLEDHVIICGYGRFGVIVAEELIRNGVRIVIIENDEARGPEIERSGAPHVPGSALADEVLIQAGIDRARAIVIATGSDSDNVFITLAAREKNPTLRIHARAESEAGIRRLELAGADQVVSAYHMGGNRMAASILRPAVVDFLEIARPAYGDQVDLEEVRVGRGSALVGQAMGSIERETPRIRVIALKRGEARIQLMPAEETIVAEGDHLVLIGDRGSLVKLAQVAGGSAGATAS
jgi:voltage-gated potassium channel